MTRDMSKKRILTGLRANNDLHIGNYFGALMPLIDMAVTKSDEYSINLFVPDLHSFTTPIDHTQLYDQIIHNLRLFAAAGLPLDNDEIHIYRQSFVPAHSELSWILDCFTGFGEMSRMTQFKDKSARINDDRISVGLFNYPVLMASDILLYRASYVPVGDDQSQHLEFARDIAARMNNQFGNIFTIPETVSDQHLFFGKDQGLRIKDLSDPSKKMSKSSESSKGIIFLGDAPAEAAKKIMAATTDSIGVINLDWNTQPGISNLLQILALLQKQPLEVVATHWHGQTAYGPLKETVANAVEKHLSDFQTQVNAVDEELLLAKLEKDEEQMRAEANSTLFTVQKAIGLRK